MKNDTYDEREQKTSEETQAERIKMKIPETTDKPNHHEATASVYIDGLSIMCANDAKKTAEIAFVKDDHTAVLVLVLNKEQQPIWWHTCDKAEKTSIVIEKSTPINIGRLYKNSQKDDDDFEWMPDLNGSDWYPHTNIEIQRGAKNYLSAKLILKDAYFYTFIRSINDAIQDRKDGSERNLGRIGRAMGADIFCDNNDSGINLIIDNGIKPESKHLPKDEGPYFILVITRGLTDSNHLHHLYHHIISLPTGQPEYDFEYRQTKKEVFVTTFACQTFPGGDGPLPDFP